MADLYVSIFCPHCKRALEHLDALGLQGVVRVRHIDGPYADAAENRGQYSAMRLRGTPTLITTQGEQFVGYGPVVMYLQGLARQLG